MVYFRYSKGNEVSNMSAFTMIVLFAFIIIQVGNFMLSIEKERVGVALMWGASIVMFAYLAKALMFVHLAKAMM